MTNPRIRYKPIDPQIEALASKHGNYPEAVLEIFQELQEEFGGLSQ